MAADGSNEILPRVFVLGAPPRVNWYVVEEGGELTAVDAGLPGFAKHLESDLAAGGFSPGDVKALVLTHSDADHTGLAPQLRAAGARVLIHSDDEDTLARPRPKGGDASPRHLLARLLKPAPWRLLLFVGKEGGARPPKVEGAETFSDGDVLDVPGRPRVVHMPGHTPGHSALLFEQHGALFVGDGLCTWNVLSDRLGPQVMPSPMNLSTEQCFQALDAIEQLDAQAVLVGHGEPFRGRPAEAVSQARAAGRS